MRRIQNCHTGFKKIFLTLYSGVLLLSTSTVFFEAKAQNGRFIQEVMLTEHANRPFISRSHSLPKMVDKGIREGKITPYSIDYNHGSVEPISLSHYKELFKVLLGPYTGGDPYETYDVPPQKLELIKLDLRKINGKINKINYIHFWGEDYQKGIDKYYFSVSYPELAAYLNKQSSLYVINKNPVVWKNQVLHTDNRYLEESISVLFPENEAICCYDVHFTEKKPWEKKDVEIYVKNNSSGRYNLVHKRNYETIALDTVYPAILLMSEALETGKFEIYSETLFSTSVTEPDAGKTYYRHPKKFFVIQKEQLDLEHPDNAMFFEPDKELSTLIIKAYEAGLIKNIYKNDSLSGRMSKAEWDDNLSIPDMLDIAGPRMQYVTRQISSVTIGWKTYFNRKGKITRAEPVTLTLMVSNLYTPNGVYKQVASFNFNEVEKVLLQLPEIREIKSKNNNWVLDLRKRKYFAFLSSTSGIVAADGPSAK